MMETQLLKKDLANVGEEISHELGAQMIMDYQAANPADTQGYYIVRNIIEQILDQPGCVGISFANAYNEEGTKTLVYSGVGEDGKVLVEYTSISKEGKLDTNKGIVADRLLGFEWPWRIIRR